MPTSPWRTLGSPDPNGDFVALLSYLPLKSYWRVLPFVFYTAQVMKQLASAQGLLGYSLLARPLSKRFWTLSALPNEEALRAFVQLPATCKHHDRACSAHGQDEVRALDGQRLRPATALG